MTLWKLNCDDSDFIHKKSDSPLTWASLARMYKIVKLQWLVSNWCCGTAATMYLKGFRVIRFENVSKTYKNGSPALKDITLDIEKGEFVFLVGASGSGKTTFLRLLLREELPDKGRILEAGRELTELSKFRVPFFAQHRLRVPGLSTAPEQDGL